MENLFSLFLLGKEQMKIARPQGTAVRAIFTVLFSMLRTAYRMKFDHDKNSLYNVWNNHEVTGRLKFIHILLCGCSSCLEGVIHPHDCEDLISYLENKGGWDFSPLQVLYSFVYRIVHPNSKEEARDYVKYIKRIFTYPGTISYIVDALRYNVEEENADMCNPNMAYWEWSSTRYRREVHWWIGFCIPCHGEFMTLSHMTSPCTCGRAMIKEWNGRGSPLKSGEE